MLKITYLEEGIYLEYLQQSVEEWKATRVLVNLRAAASIHIENGAASLVLPLDNPYLDKLEELEARELIEVTLCDEEYIEVALFGIWVAQNQESEEGVFACELERSHEHFLYELWQESQFGTSVMSE